MVFNLINCPASFYGYVFARGLLFISLNTGQHQNAPADITIMFRRRAKMSLPSSSLTETLMCSKQNTFGAPERCSGVPERRSAATEQNNVLVHQKVVLVHQNAALLVLVHQNDALVD